MNPDNIDVFALLGQSNMDGTGSLDDFDNRTHDRILRVTRRNTLVVASEPLNEAKVRDNDSNCVGPGMPFARAMLPHLPGRHIALLHRGAGGTQLSQWLRDGNSYQTSIKLLLEARKCGNIKGVLWHQGESDADDREKAETYAGRFALFAAAIRDDLGIADLPIVAGQLGPFLLKRKESPYAHIVNEQILTLPNRIDNLAVVTSEGTTDIGDTLHFDARSQVLMGARYAAKMAELIQAQKR